MAKRVMRDDIDKFMEYGIYLPTRTIYIGSIDSDVEGNESGTDFKMAERVVKALHILDNVSNEPITIIMNNLGGFVWHGMAIYSAIKKCRSRVVCKGVGSIMSMGAIIFQAADERILDKYAVFMIHHGYDGMADHVKTVRSWNEFSKKYDKIVNSILYDKIKEKHPEFSAKKLDRMMDFDAIMTAQEAVELGLADSVE